MSYQKGSIAGDKSGSLGIPIVMPREGSTAPSFPKKSSEADFNLLPSLTTSPRRSPLPSPRPRHKGLNSLSSLKPARGGADKQGLPKGPHAQVVLLKRKRNEEPLDGLCESILLQFSLPLHCSVFDNVKLSSISFCAL